MCEFVHTHDSPVVSVKYSSCFRQVITVCEGSVSASSSLHGKCYCVRAESTGDENCHLCQHLGAIFVTNNNFSTVLLLHSRVRVDI